MKIRAKNHGKGFKGWLAWKLVKLAQWIYPESEDVKAFYLQMMTDYMVEGRFVTRVNFEEMEH